MKRSCKKCVSFKSRQGTGAKGECRFNPPVILLGSTFGEFPIVTDGTWCRKYELNRDKYNEDGRKIYTKKNTRTIRRSEQLDAQYDAESKWFHRPGCDDDGR